MRTWLLLLLACLPVLDAKAQSSPVPPRGTVAFVGVHVLPMDQDRALAGQTVLVEDGRIAAIGGALPLPPEARVVDGDGAWLLPGLADMHNHLDGRQDMAVQLALGITTTLHMGEARNSFVGRTRAAVAAGELVGPRSFVALAVDGSPRYGHLVVRDADDARATVRVAQANGYDALKLYNNLSPAAFEALMTEARVAGLPVVGHGVTAVGLRRQLEAGMALVAHLEEFFYTFFPPAPDDDPNAAPDPAQIEAAVALLRTRGTPVVADLVTYRTIAAQWGRPEVVTGFLLRPETRYLPPQFRVSWPAQGYASREGSLDRREAFLPVFVRALQEAGVPLLSGTDAQDIPGLVGGFALHDNLDALVDAGLTPYEALVTATRAPGEFVRRHWPDLALSGVVAPGARADLVLVRDDPRTGLATLRQPLGVMADGRWYPGDDLAGRLEDVERQYRAAAHDALELPSAASDRARGNLAR
ncbi:amidohydrolase family protein [Flavobacterium sp. MXW15]|uniref:Amidohydrolase family protein n=1 Tax=Xanthomonas chitinilytica TaxID=2989819 RepID=A0ABT3JWY2_9XANT|nr:amidohydrolase family protein [Xanthomonas sp. H13-6]MCW4455782.1 amidohydrolase family protein [Flavobacterium sp. MXW15]MCW4472998.1 amidohydrolase family protein [Xanthomonas sp. H13-6]